MTITYIFQKKTYVLKRKKAIKTSIYKRKRLNSFILNQLFPFSSKFFLITMFTLFTNILRKQAIKVHQFLQHLRANFMINLQSSYSSSNCSLQQHYVFFIINTQCKNQSLIKLLTLTQTSITYVSYT